MPSRRRDLIHELQRVAELPPSSGRTAIAKTTALRALLRLEGESVLTGPEERLWDEDRDPEERVDERDWHPDPDFRRLPSSTRPTRSRHAGAGGSPWPQNPAAGAEWPDRSTRPAAPPHGRFKRKRPGHPGPFPCRCVRLYAPGWLMDSRCFPRGRSGMSPIERWHHRAEPRRARP